MPAVLGLDGISGQSSFGATNLVEPSEVETYLGYTFDDQDLLQTWINRAEAVILRWTGREALLPAEVTEYLDGNAQGSIYLRRWPIIEIASLYVDQGGYYGSGTGAFPESSLLTANTQYRARRGGTDLCRGEVVRTDGYNWPIGFGNIKVIYTAGYDPVPEDLKLAVMMLIQSHIAAQSTGVVDNYKSVTHGEFSITLGDIDGDNLSSIKSILSRFKERT